MVQILSLALTAAALFSAATAESYLHVNKGCVWSRLWKNGPGGQCAPKEASRRIGDTGHVNIWACVKTEHGKDVAYCRYGMGDAVEGRPGPGPTKDYKPIPKDWKDVYWGENNCLYGPGRHELGCAEHFSPGFVLPQKIYN